jgi:hypothetical protein
MCTHDAEKLAISVLEIWEDGYREERTSSLEIPWNSLVPPLSQLSRIEPCIQRLLRRNCVAFATTLLNEPQKSKEAEKRIMS